MIVVCTLWAILCWKQQGFSGNDFYLRMFLTLFLLVLVLCFLLTPLLPSFLLFNYFLWRPPYLLITKLTCLWFPTNCRLRSLAVSLKAFACFSRIRILHAFELSFLPLPAIGYTSRWGRNRAGKLQRTHSTVYEQWVTTSCWKKSCFARKAERWWVPELPGGFQAPLHVSDAGRQFMV